MGIPVYPASAWNALCAQVRAAFPYSGSKCRLAFDPSNGITLSSDIKPDETHPWKLRCYWSPYPPETRLKTGRDGQPITGEWQAIIEPGFVNGRDAFLPSEDPKTKAAIDVPLTEETPPFLRLLSFRSPIASTVLGATLEGDITYKAGEGYPVYFEKLGVKPAAKGGRFAEPPYDPDRQRELRAIDVVLTKPRLGAAISTTILNPLSTGYTHQLETSYQNAYYLLTQGRVRIHSTPKFAPLESQDTDSPLLGLPLNADDPQQDQIQLSTVYLVSPGPASEDAVPDETWEAYPQHLVFWNLCHATRFIPAPKPLPPIRIITGLGLGLLDTLANALIAPLNSGFDEINNFLNQANMRGKFWNI